MPSAAATFRLLWGPGMGITTSESNPGRRCEMIGDGMPHDSPPTMIWHSLGHSKECMSCAPVAVSTATIGRRSPGPCAVRWAT